VLLCVASVFAALLAAVPTAAAQGPLDDLDCATYGPDEQEICSGEVRSFDGSRLDVDVTKPLNDDGSKRHPLIVMMHGFGNTKHEWQSTTDAADGADKWHWNSHWFAKHGYYVLTYTARGFCHNLPTRGTGPAPCAPPENHRPWQPDSPEFTSQDPPNGTIHIKSREFEVRDTQWLAALVAASFDDVDPSKVAVTGGSYGGGESWLQASQAQWTFPAECTDGPPQPTACADAPEVGELPVLDLQAAVPKYPWTDQSYSLAPNGHGGGPSGQDLYESAQGQAESPTGQGNPVGVIKLTWVNGLFAIGNTRGMFEAGTTTTPSEEGPINIPLWYQDGVVTGDPYTAGGTDRPPFIGQIRRGLTEYRGAYYQDQQWAAQEDGRKVAIFSIQGWTDDLFPAIESFRMFKYLKRLDPRWPVEVAVADVGHARGQNKPEHWHRLNGQAWQWVQSNINGSHEQQTTVSSMPTICPGDPNQSSIQRLTATSPEGLANGTLTVRYDAPGTINSPGGVADPTGPRTDPILGEGGCQETEGDPGFQFTKYSRLSAPLQSTKTYVGLGFVTLPAPAITANTATINARVWDKPPEGPERLVSRGTYRYDAPTYDTPGSPELRVPLFGNHFTVDPGHQIRLEVTLVDFPTFRPSNVPSQATFGPPSVTLPIRQAGERTLGP
jgi:dienelactone hydrolase